MSVIVKRPWTKQPPAGTPINWGNPITRGLVGLVAAQDGPINLVNKELGTVVNSGLPTGAGAHGVSFKGDPLDATADGWKFTISGRADGDVECSLLSVASQVDGQAESSDDRNIASIRCNSKFHYIQHAYDNFTGVAKLLMRSRDNANFVQFSGGDFALEDIEDQARLSTIFSVDSTTSARVTCTGRNKTLTEALTPSIGSSWFPTEFYVGAGTTTDLNFNTEQADDIYLVGVWIRALSNAEQLALSRNPWIIFQPRTQIIGAEAGGGGGTDVLLADDVQSTSEVSSPTVGQEHALLADDVQSTSEVSSPAIALEYQLLADDVQSTSEVTAPTVGQEHAILADDVQSTSEVTAPTLATASHNLLAEDLESQSELSTPVVAQIHNLTADDVQSTSEVTAPTVGQEHAILADDVESASSVSFPTLSEASLSLSADDVESASELSTPALGQVFAFQADDVQSTSEVTAPAVGQGHVLLADDVQTTTEVSVPTLSQIQALLVDDVQTTTEVSSPALGTGYTLIHVSVESQSELSLPDLGSTTNNLFADDIQSITQLSFPTVSDGTVGDTGPTFVVDLAGDLVYDLHQDGEI